jgi:hypothetical protein
MISDRQRREYDRFGPWTYPVRTPDEMPPRFDGWYEELKGSALILKLPFSVERRAATPGGDLYERVLAVGSGGIVSLGLSGHEVIRRDIAFAEISGLRLAQELLLCRFAIDLVDGSSFTAVFNAVSVDEFDSFIDAVRAELAALKGNRRFVPTELAAGPSDKEMLFQIRLISLRKRQPGFALAAYQAPCVLETGETAGRHGLIGLANRILRWRLDGCFLAANQSELAVFLRGAGVPRFLKSPGFRNELIFIPAASFRAAAVESRIIANGARVFILRISQSGRDYELLFDRDPSAALAVLGLIG